MKKRVIGLLLLSFVFILAACSAQNLSEEEVLKKINEETEGVNSYHVILDANFTLNTPTGTENSLQRIDITADEEKNRLHLNLKSEGIDVNETIESYLKDSVVYRSIDNNGWTKHEEGVPHAKNSILIPYNKVVYIYQTISDQLDFEIYTDYYLFSFKGKSTMNYELLNVPYISLAIKAFDSTEFDENDIIHDLQIKVDKKTHYITEVKNTMIAEKDDQKAEFIMHTVFSEINKVEEIIIPEDILNSLEWGYKLQGTLGGI